MDPDPPPTDRDSTTRTIMEATDQALRTHGYAALSVSSIAAEMDLSKSSLYYHYEDKDELLVAFLDYTVRRLLEDASLDDGADAEERLRSFVDLFLPASLDQDRREFQAALLELRAQAPHEEAYREQFESTDRMLRSRLREFVEVGIEDGQFRDVDPEQTAQLLLSALYGGMLERTTGGSPDTASTLRDGLDAYIENVLSAE